MRCLALAAALGCGSAPPEPAPAPRPPPETRTAIPEDLCVAPEVPCASWVPPAALPGPSSAARSADARDHFGRARRFYEEGDYDSALGEFENAYRLAPLAPLLFNIGQVHEKNRSPACAIDAFHAYLTSSAPPPADMAEELRGRIDELRREVEAQSGCGEVL